MPVESAETTTKVKDTTANPGPLGLMGFGMTTVLLNLLNSSSLGSDALVMILAMGIFYGGIAQIIAGIMEWKKGNTFAATAFCSYGSFWLTFVFLKVVPISGLMPAASATAVGAYLMMWGLFTGIMFIGTLRLNRALQFIFLSLTILFFILAIGDFTGNKTITQIGGYEGIICGFSAIYTGLAQVLNEVYGRTIAPLCPWKPKQPLVPAMPTQQIYSGPQPPPGTPPQH